MWHVSPLSGVATLRTAMHLLLTYLLTPSISRVANTGARRRRRGRGCPWQPGEISYDVVTDKCRYDATAHGKQYHMWTLPIIDNARIVGLCGAAATVGCLSICPSVPSIDSSSVVQLVCCNQSADGRLSIDSCGERQNSERAASCCDPRTRLIQFVWLLRRPMFTPHHIRMWSPTILNKKLSYRRGTARCVVSVEISPIVTQQCRNYL